MLVRLSWREVGLAIGTTSTARFGDEATIFRLAGQLALDCADGIRSRTYQHKRQPRR